MDNKIDKIKDFFSAKEKIQKQNSKQHDYFVFKDKSGQIQIANVRYVPKNYISIDCSTINDESSGYLRIYDSADERLFLDVITVYTQFRGRGIATTLSDIAEIYMAKEAGKELVFGVFNPTQLGDDRDNNVVVDESELNAQAESFYIKNGYTIIKPEEHAAIAEQDHLFKDIDYFTEDPNSTLVVKNIPDTPSENFTNINGIYYQNELCEEISSPENFQN